MSLINVTNLTFAYEGTYQNIFENVSFRIDTDWRLGFTGRNGRGKTTFFRLLLGEYPYQGSISASVDFEYFPFTVQNPEYFTIDVIREIAPEAMDWEIMKEMSQLDVSDDVLYRQFCLLSKGEQTKAMIAALFLKSNAFLLIDEPTNHLDALGRETLGQYLKRKKGFILISHDRCFLDGCIDHILAINKTNIEIQKGNFSSWQQNKQLQDAYELAENEKLKKDIARLSASAKRTEGWSQRVERSKKGAARSSEVVDKGFIGHKSAKMMKRAKATENRQQELIAQKSSLLKNIEGKEALSITPLVYHSDRLCELSHVSIRYGEQDVCRDVSFCIRQGERISVAGGNGSGKSSILKLICGYDIPHTGQLYRGSGLRISYVPQSTEQLCGNLSDYARECGIEESLFKTILRKLDFSREQFEKPMESFSGGQKKKVLLARSLSEQAHLYIWDEPLNFIDVISRIQLEELLQDCQSTILFVEHDKAFCNHIATKVITI